MNTMIEKIMVIYMINIKNLDPGCRIYCPVNHTAGLYNLWSHVLNSEVELIIEQYIFKKKPTIDCSTTAPDTFDTKCGCIENIIRP